MVDCCESESFGSGSEREVRGSRSMDLAIESLLVGGGGTVKVVRW